MEEQIVKQINDDISKNPNCECYHIRKYFGDKPLEEYSVIRMMETLQDGFIAPGVKDSELVSLLIYRAASSKHKDVAELVNCLANALDYFLEIEERG